MKNIVIIGNGIAGVTAATRIREYSSDSITIISAESKHFFSRTALMYIYMGHMEFEHTKPYEDWFWKENKIDLLHDYVTTINTETRSLLLQSGIVLQYDTLILATGSQSNKFGWQGQDLNGVQGLYSLQDLQLMEYNTRGISRAVVVGGGLIGIEAAEMLHSRNISVTFLVRENRYWGNILPEEEARLVERHIREHHVDLRLDTELDSILSDGANRVRAIRTKSGEEIPCEFVLLSAGVHPNISVVQHSGIECGRGVKVNEYFETNVPNVYAIGDCAEIVPANGGRSRIEPLWYAGRAHGNTVANTIVGQRTLYRPETFFNSAKFFDVEYQTYGTVKNELQHGEHTLYWQHPTNLRCVRIVYTDECVIGINVFGIRYRQAVCQQWLEDKRTIEEILERLGEANFDPEFFPQFEDDVVRQYNQQHPGKNIALKQKRGLSTTLADLLHRRRKTA